MYFFPFLPSLFMKVQSVIPVVLLLLLQEQAITIVARYCKQTETSKTAEVCHLGSADCLLGLPDCPLGSPESLLGSAENLLGSADCCLVSSESLLGSADCLLSLTESLLGSPDCCLGSAESLLGSAESLLSSADWTTTPAENYTTTKKSATTIKNRSKAGTGSATVPPFQISRQQFFLLTASAAIAFPKRKVRH